MTGRFQILSALVLAIGLTAAVPAQAKLKEAEVAFQARDFATVLKELKPYLKKKRRPVRVSLIMARMHLDGLGVPANYSRAYQYLLPPAKKGNAWAATELGKLFLNGSGVIHSFATAASWFHKAAKVGYSPAQLELGHMHAKGQSVPVNNMLAYAWYNLAASGLMGEKRDVATQRRDTLAMMLTDAEIAIAQAQSFEWSELIEVVEPDVVSLLDQATILAEKKIEQAAMEIRKVNESVAQKLSSSAPENPGKDAKKSQKEDKRSQKEALEKGQTTTVYDDGKTKITHRRRTDAEIRELLEKQALEATDVSFVQAISAAITSAIVSIFGSTEPPEPTAPTTGEAAPTAKSG